MVFLRTHFPKYLLACLALFALGNNTRAQEQGPPAKYFDERFVIRSMALITAAQATYQATTGQGRYGSLGQLSGLVGPALASGRKYGYTFEVVASANTYTARAMPVVYRRTGLRSYYTDQRGVVFGGDLGGGPANDKNAHYIDTCAFWGISDNERCTIAAVRTLFSAQLTYASTVGNGDYAPTIISLFNVGLIDMVLAAGAKHGYAYTLEAIPGSERTLRIWARPQQYGTTGIRSFYIDLSGVVRGADKQGGHAGPADPPVN